jgi:galactose oxidase
MNHGRWFPNSVLLPDGTLFVAGGGLIYNAEPVMESEIFDPVSETWTLDAPMSVPRLYHSTALLLPDGRVWMAGTDGETRIELYSPDYLFAGPRPILFTAPASVTYGQQFPIPMADPGDVAAACFIRLSAVTHAFNMGQRYVPLDTAVSGPNELQVTAPTDPFVAPPGHYLLFVRNQAGVPAEAPIISLVVT